MGETGEPWRHVGRVETAGEQFLLLDEGLLGDWRSTDEQVNELIDLGDPVITMRVGDGVAGIVSIGTVNDEGWLEVFQRGTDRVAVVHGMEGYLAYRDVMVQALSYPSTPTEAEDAVIEIGSGQLILWDSALDGVEDVDSHLRDAVAGRLPRSDEPVQVGSPLHPNGLRIPVRPGIFRIHVLWDIELDGNACFARWLLTHENRPSA